MEVHKQNKEIPFHHSISSYSSPPQSSLAQGEKSPTLDPSHKLNSSNSHPQDPSPSPSLSPGPSSSSSPRKEVMVRYRECQRNYSAHLGSHVVDGCGEFMPSGEEGTHLALKCAACECHRSFHRREVEGETMTMTTTTTAANLALMQQATPASLPAANMGTTNCYISFSKYHKNNNNNSSSNNLVPIRPNNDNFTITPPPPIPSAAAAMQLQQNHHGRSRTPVMMAFGGGGAAAESSSEDLNAYRTGDFDYGGHQYGVSKKRHRTKFSQEQKDKMMEFAEKVGWRMQKQDDAELQRFCHEVGVKRQVFKVWMHNNKQAIKKKQP